MKQLVHWIARLAVCAVFAPLMLAPGATASAHGVEPRSALPLAQSPAAEPVEVANHAAADQQADVTGHPASAQSAPPAVLPAGSVVTYPAPLEASTSPAPAGHVAVDPAVPGWTTSYGDPAMSAMSASGMGTTGLGTTGIGTTGLGTKFAPRHPVFEAMADGPEVPLTGWWSSETLQNDAHGITAIADAPDGRVFVGVGNDGLRVYAPGPGGVYAWTAIHPPARGLGLASNKVTSLAIFSGALWVGTSDAGVSVMQLDTGVWSVYNVANSDLPSNAVNRLTAYQPPRTTGYIWVSTNGGAARFASNTWTVYTTANGLPSNTVRDVAVQVVGLAASTWVSTDSGLMRLTSGVWTQVLGPASCGFERASRVVVDHNADVWIGAEDNVPAQAAQLAARAQGQGKKTAQDKDKKTERQSDGTTSSVATTSVAGQGTKAQRERAISPAGLNVWLPLGVCQYKRLSGTWANYTSGLPGLPSNVLNDMDVDAAGRVWMAFPAGAAVYDQGTWGIFKLPAAALATANVSAVHVVDEAVWFGHYNLTAVTRHSPNWLRYSAADLGGGAAPPPTALFMGSDTLWAAVNTGFAALKTGDLGWTYKNITGNASPTRSLVRDAAGNLWIGTNGNGVYQWNGTTFASHATTADGLPGNQVRALAVDHTDRLWVGTDGGLALRANGYWLAFTTANSALVSNDIQALGVDALDRIWVGTAANGISILDPDAQNGPEWLSQTTADGLPANTITGIATEPLGAVWAATGQGLARWDPATATWTKHTTATGALPNDSAESVASDPLGRARAGTDGGLGWQTASGWRAFHATGSALAGDGVGAVAADADRGWAVAGGGLALRGEIKGPIGTFAPVVTSFTPPQGPPGVTVTINGSHFDDRGPEFNSVFFAYLDSPGFQAKVLSASATSLSVEVPVLVKPGKIYVRSNGLTGQSSTDFKVAPVITSVVGTCLVPGEVIKVNGNGLNIGSYTTWIKIGGGAWRLVDIADPTQVQDRIQPGDTSGTVSIRLESNGPVATSAASVDITSIVVSGSSIQQGIENQPMIWGKKTLVQVFMKYAKSGTACSAHVTSGLLYWKKKSGPAVLGGTGVLASPDGLTVNDKAPSVSMTGGMNFVAEFESGRSGWTPQFALSDFNGVQIKLKNGPVEVVTVDLPASAFNYIDTQDRWYWTSMQVIPSNWSPAKEQNYWKDAVDNLTAAARIFPQQDSSWHSGPHAWLGWTPIYYVRDDVDLYLPGDGKGSIDDGASIISLVADYLDPSGDNYGAALVAPEAGDPANTAAGLSNGGHTAFVFNDPGTGGKTFMHEATHNFGAVDSSQMNYSGGPNGAHSRYDEGQWGDVADCDSSLTFRQALIDETGKVERVVALTDGDPAQVPTNMCGPKSQAKSLLSYAPKRNNDNAFLEPLEMQFLLAKTCDPVSRCPGYDPSVFMVALQAAEKSLTAARAHEHDALHKDGHALRHGTEDIGNGEDSAPDAIKAANAEQSLRISGYISQTGAVEARIAFIEDTAAGRTPAEPGGDYRLRLRGAGSQLLLDFPFDVSFRLSHGHGEDAQGHEGHGHGEDGLMDRGQFNLRVPFPAGTAKAELVHDDAVIWSRTVSADAPTASFTSPNGGSYGASSTIQVQWTAADPDGDALQFGLDYSADNGQTWAVIAPYLMTNTFSWKPGYTPPSPTARLRLRASDGFNSVKVLSAPFAVTAKAPLALIKSPAAGAELTEHQTIDLVGDSVTADGFGAGTFAWTLDNNPAGASKHVSLTLGTVGLHTIKLTVNADSMASSATVTVTVAADYDHDGMPNAWELQYKLNPLNRSDAAGDPDGDGLTNREEYRLGTNPRIADTDGDGALDGAEIAADTDPLSPASNPAAGPVLNVGVGNLKFTAVQGSAPILWPAWVTNGGAGTLNWNAVTDMAWLSATPNIGTAPTQATVAAAPGSLVPGTYTGHLTFSAAGAAKSPRVVTVTLEIVPGPAVPPTATPMPGPSATATNTPSATATSVVPAATDSPTATPTEEGRRTATPTPTEESRPTPTDDPRRVTPTPTDEPRPSATVDPRRTATPTPMPTATEEPRRTPTDFPTRTSVPTEEPTRPAEATATRVRPATATPTRSTGVERWRIFVPYVAKNQRMAGRVRMAY